MPYGIGLVDWEQTTIPPIDVAVTTVERPVDYIHQLIAQLRVDLKVRLVIGAPEYEYLKRYSDDRYRELIKAPLQEWERFQDCCVHHRAAWNYWRALTLGSCSPYSKGLVVFEDDTIPIEDWERRLACIIDQIEMQHSSPYILALYAAAQTGLRPSQNGALFVPYPPDRFFGNCCIYYPELVREGFAKYLKAHGVDAFRMPYDLLLGQYAERESVPIFAAIPCLAQHIGKVSTGLSEVFYQANQI